MPFKDLPKISFIRKETGGILALIGEYQAEEGETVRTAAVPLASKEQIAAWETLLRLNELTTHAVFAEVICAVAIAGYEYGRSERGPEPPKERRKRK